MALAQGPIVVWGSRGQIPHGPTPLHWGEQREAIVARLRGARRRFPSDNMATKVVPDKSRKVKDVDLHAHARWN